ncbi:MAG: hypothetical protein AB1626_03830 [Candidatus Micrarchaeota archaeon]
MAVEKTPVLHPEVRITLTGAAARLRRELRQPGLEEARRKALEARLGSLEDARAGGSLNQEAAEAVLNEMQAMLRWAEFCSETARAWPGKQSSNAMQLRKDAVAHRQAREILKRARVRQRDMLSEKRGGMTPAERALRNLLTERLRRLE